MINQWLDACGREIKVDHYFAHATQRGDRTVINFGRVAELFKDDRGQAKIRASTTRRDGDVWLIPKRLVVIERLDCLIIDVELPHAARLALE